MATIDASIPLQGKRPDTFGRLSQLIGIQQQQQELKSQEAAARSAQMTQKQREQLAAFDVSKIIGEDGTIDLNKIPGSGLREAAGDKFPEVLSQYAQVKQQQLAAKQALVQLTDAQRKSFGELVGGVMSDPDVAQDTPAGRQKVAQAFGQYAQMYGPDVENVLRAYAAPIQNAPQGKITQVLRNIRLQAQSASEQAARLTPQYMSTGGQFQNINPDVQASPIAATIAPGQQSQIVTDPAGLPLEQRRDPRGNITGVRPVAGMPDYAPGEVGALEQQAETNMRNIEANRIAASLAPQQLDQIDKALKISESVSTGGGEWARTRAKVESQIAAVLPGFDAATDDATKLQMLDKYLERIAADSARVLGANASTDAARESIARQNASTGYTRDAVQAVLQYAKAQTLAMAAKGDAQEKWLKENRLTKQHDFETKWRQNYDPLIFQLQAMTPDQRKKAIDALSDKEAETLRRKRNELKEMGGLNGGR